MTQGKIIGKRIVFPRIGEVEIEDFEVPRPGSNQVLVETLNTLISPGTETSWLYALPNTPGKFPQHPGYSNVGIITEVGNEVTKVKVGDKVFSMLSHATHGLTKEDDVFNLPNGLPLEEASFTYLGAVALQGVRKADIELGEAVVVMGLGLIGQLALQFARLSGARPSIGVDFVENRLAVAKKLGADYAINAKNDIVKEVKEITGGKGAHAVIDATGSPLAPSIAVKLARDFGRVIILGSPRGESKFNFYSEVHRKGLSIIGSYIRPRYDSSHGRWTVQEDIAVVLNLLSRRELKVKELITKIMPFSEAVQAYKLLMEAKEKVIGIVLSWK